MNQEIITPPSDKLLTEAIQKIHDAISDAVNQNESDPRVMALATSSNNIPTVRSILIADINNEGLLFFVNSRSGKGIQLAENPHAALSIYWKTLELQLVIDGLAVRAEQEEAETIWSRRERSKQIAAWASKQSSESQGNKNNEIESISKEFSSSRVPIPQDWCAYRIHPTRVEFWQAGWKKIRDRCSYQYRDNEWIKLNLDP